MQMPVLKLQDLTKPFTLCFLLQENDGKLYPVGYASKMLNLAEARYLIIEKEYLAVSSVGY